jgi:hypothetical protein
MLPWLGHGICLECGKVHKQILSAPDDCSCGVRLLPRGKLVAELLMRARGLDKSKANFSGRPVCSKCAESANMNGGELVDG